MTSPTARPSQRQGWSTGLTGAVWIPFGEARNPPPPLGEGGLGGRCPGQAAWGCSHGDTARGPSAEPCSGRQPKRRTPGKTASTRRAEAAAHFPHPETNARSRQVEGTGPAPTPGSSLTQGGCPGSLWRLWGSAWWLRPEEEGSSSNRGAEPSGTLLVRLDGQPRGAGSLNWRL